MIKGLETIGVTVFILFVAWAIETLRESRMPAARRFWLSLALGALCAIAVMVTWHAAQARDLGQWENSDRSTRDWYQSLMQPDVPNASCCGEADAYFADEIHYRDGKTFAVITDDRPDEPRGRPHLDIGTEVEIPNNKLKWDRGNPTGHGVVFLSRAGYVFCYVQPGGA